MSYLTIAVLCLSTLSLILAYNVSDTELVKEIKTKPNASTRRVLDIDILQSRIVNQAPTSLTARVNPQTSLYIQPDRTNIVYIDVTNNNDWRTLVNFYCSATTSTIQNVQPVEAWITGYDTMTVKVILRTDNVVNSKDTLVFTAVTYSSTGDDPTTIKAHLFVGQQVTDSTGPDVSYSVTGDCRGTSSPSSCSAATWGLQATIQDKQSGLLSVETVPAGFVFTSDFIAGTKDEVSGRYSASCCLNKVDIIATDINGNQDRTSIDINNIWLSTGAIVAIVLGCILIIIIVILICCGIVMCIRKRNKTNTFTMHT